MLLLIVIIMQIRRINLTVRSISCISTFTLLIDLLPKVLKIYKSCLSEATSMDERIHNDKCKIYDSSSLFNNFIDDTAYM
jgi:hypothetical protein